MPRKRKLKTSDEIAEQETTEAAGDGEEQEQEQGEQQELAATSEPGEQGIATQDDDGDDDGEEAEPFQRNPTEMELKLADDVYRDLMDNALQMGATTAVEKLLRTVDVHRLVCMPTEWNHEGDYAASSYLSWIGRILCRAVPKIEISGERVLFWWRNTKSWNQHGRPVRAIGRPLSAGERFLSDGAKAVVIANFPLFRHMNTQQRIAAVYKALRSLDAEGARRPPQFVGYYDELELFGVGTYEDDALLIRALEAGIKTELPWTNRIQTSLFEQAEAVDPDHADEEDQEEKKNAA